MLLIKEELQDVEYLTEDDAKGNKSWYLQGIFMQAEQKNRNGRVYPREILGREVDRYNENYVKKNRAFGELGHPDSPAINLDRVSHMITKLYPDGNNFIGKAKIVDTPNGKIVKSLLDGGARLGVSTRGVGSLKPANGYQLVQDDFRLATAADIVADPSGPNCFVDGIMENFDWWINNASGEWQRRYISDARKKIKTFTRNEIEEKAISIFENFIRKL